MTAAYYFTTVPGLEKTTRKSEPRLIPSKNCLPLKERARILYEESHDHLKGIGVSDAFAEGAMFVCATVFATLERNWHITKGKSPKEARQVVEWAITDAGLLAEEYCKIMSEGKSKKEADSL